MPLCDTPDDFRPFLDGHSFKPPHCVAISYKALVLSNAFTNKCKTPIKNIFWAASPLYLALGQSLNPWKHQGKLRYLASGRTCTPLTYLPTFKCQKEGQMGENV